MKKKKFNFNVEQQQEQQPVANDPALMDGGLRTLGGMLGGQSIPSEFLNNVVEENNNEIIEGNAEIIEESTDNNTSLPATGDTDNDDSIISEHVDYAHFIKSVTPLAITEKPVSGSDIPNVAILFLCKDTEDKFFILKRLIVLEDKNDIELVINNPLYTENNFVNKKAVAGLLLSGLESYYTDLDFDVNPKTYTYDENPIVTCEVYAANNAVVNIAMNLEQFGALAYTEFYTFNGMVNRHDLTIATVSGSGVLDHEKEGKPNSFFLVEDIEEIVSMAPAIPKEKGLFKKNKVNANSIGLVLKLSRAVQQDDRLVKEYVYTLLPIETEQKCDKKKFKGETIQNITEKFYGDADQYICTYMINDMRFISLDKQFMMFRGKSKNNDTYMFLLDTSLCNKLERLIEAY